MRRTVTMLALLLLAAPAAAQEDTLPPEVARFYRAQNTVAALTTPAERQVLTRQERPDPSADERLQQAHALLRSLAALELAVDPGITRPAPVLGIYVPARLLEIRRSRYTRDGELHVELTAYELDRERNLRLIARYEHGKIPREPHPRLYSPVSTPELHVWIRTDAGWRKRAAGITLLHE